MMNDNEKETTENILKAIHDTFVKAEEQGLEPSQVTVSESVYNLLATYFNDYVVQLFGAPLIVEDDAFMGDNAFIVDIKDEQSVNDYYNSWGDSVADNALSNDTWGFSVDAFDQEFRKIVDGFLRDIRKSTAPHTPNTPPKPKPFSITKDGIVTDSQGERYVIEKMSVDKIKELIHTLEGKESLKPHEVETLGYLEQSLYQKGELFDD